MRRLHRDRELHEMLDKLMLLRSHPAAVAMRRLFSNRAEFDAFFQHAFPGYVHSQSALALFDGALTTSVSYIRALEVMEDVQAQRSDFEAVAFLVSDGDNDRDRRIHPFFNSATPEVRRQSVEVARQFLDQFRGLPTDELRTAFRGEDWRDFRQRKWLSGCMQHGVPADFLNRVISDETNRSYGWMYLDQWKPENVARYYKEGASAEYIIRFWERVEQFEELWEADVPFEYAVAMIEGADR